MVVAVVPIDVAVVVGRRCEIDECCDTKCGDFFDKGGILEGDEDKMEDNDGQGRRHER